MARRGIPSAHERPDGRWAAVIPLEGGKRKWIYGKTENEVQAKVIETLADQQRGELATGTSMTVGAYLDWWLEHMKPTIRYNTHRSYVYHLRHARPHLGSIRLTALKPSHIARCVDGMRRDGISDSEIKSTLSRLRQAFRAAVKLEMMRRNPAESIRPPRVDVVEPKSLTQEQAAHLLSVNEDHGHYALWALMLATGLRGAEALGLRWSDIDKDWTIRVRNQVQYDPEQGWHLAELKTKHAKRTLRLGPEMAAMLQEHRERQSACREKVYRPRDLVFERPNGDFISRPSAYNRFQVALKRAGLPHFRLHDLRHTYGTWHLEQGTDLRVVARLMGHSSYLITANIYTHPTEQLQDEASLRIDGLLRRKK